LGGYPNHFRYSDGHHDSVPEEDGMRLPYISAERPKSARERYIRVAAIDIVISEGMRNICIAGRQKGFENHVSCHSNQTSTY